MIDAKRVLDAVVGASSRPGTGGTPGAALGQLAATAKDFIARNPGLAEAALMSIAGLLLRSPKGRGIARGIAGLGGLAVVGGLADQAFRNHEARAGGSRPRAHAAAPPARGAAPPRAAGLHPGPAAAGG